MASVSAGGVHEAGKSIDKTEALFSQERDPRFAEMYSGISGCMNTHTHCPETPACLLAIPIVVPACLCCSVNSIILALILCVAGDKKMMVPSSSAGGQQLYSQSSPFQQGHSGKSFR